MFILIRKRIIIKTVAIILFFLFLPSCLSDKEVKKNNKKHTVNLGGVFHKVKEGESLWAISRAYNVPLEDIIEINDINPEDTIYPGDEIFIPGVKRQINKPILSRNVNKRESSNYKYKRAENKNKKQRRNKRNDEKCQDLMIWPVNGVVITEFGLNGNLKSDGMDIVAPLGSDVRAVLDGKVIYSGMQPGYGNIVIIKHDKNLISIYAHNEKNFVKKGQKVNKGQKIATVGSSGNAQRYQLHFEIRRGVKAVNPNPCLIKD